MHCANRPPYIDFELSKFRVQIDKLYAHAQTNKVLDKILKQAIKEYDSKNWYQKIRDYIKKYINLIQKKLNTIS